MQQLKLRQAIALVSMTNEQKKATEYDGKSILVSASAGSGKTEVLSKRILSKILLQKSSIANILAVTFTNAAAVEMKLRVEKALQDELTFKVLSDQEMEEKVYNNEENLNKLKLLYENYLPLNDEEQAYIKDELSKLVTADITTIDGFALSILKRFYPVLKDFDATCLDRLLPNAKRKAYLNLSIKQVIQKYRATHYDLLQQHSHTKSFERLIAVLNGYLDPLTMIDVWQQQHLTNDLSNLNTKAFYEFRTKMLVDALQEPLTMLVKLYNDPQCVKLADVRHLEKNKNNAAVQKRFSNYELDKMVLAQLLNNDVNSPSNYLDKIDAGFTKLTLSNYDINNDYKDLVNKYLKQFNEIYALLASICDSGNHQAKDFSIFYTMLKEVYQLYTEYKKQDNYIEFGDITRYAINILEENEHIKVQYQERFDEILVDEFQDTNEVQDYLIKLISRHNDNVFRVGDIKQSIYKFRQAKPDIMKKYYQEYQEQGTGENIVLNYNFRSAPAIVQFNNLAYQKLMNVKYYPSAFNDDSDLAYHLKCDKQFQQCDAKEIGSISLKNLVTHDGKEIKKVDSDTIYQYAIQQIVEDKRNNHKTYSDYAILVHDNKAVSKLKKMLMQLAVPVIAVSEELLYDNEIIQLIIAINKLADDYNYDLGFVALATSFMFQKTFDELSNLRLLENKGSLYTIAKTQAEYQKIVEFIQVLKQLNSLEKRIKYFVNYQINDHLQVYNHYLTQEDQACVNELLRILKTQNLKSLDDSLTFLTNLENSDYTKPTLENPQIDAVKVMTIHKSKGLEFKEVYLLLPVLKTISNTNYQFHDDLGLAFSEGDKDAIQSLYYTLIKQKDQLSNIEEALRVLYVATTRAKSKLVIVGTTSDIDDELTFLTFEKGSKDYLRYYWVLASYLQTQTVVNQSLCTFETIVDYEFKELAKEDNLVDLTLNSMDVLDCDVKAVLQYTQNSPHSITKVKKLVFGNDVDYYQRGTNIHESIENVGKIINKTNYNQILAGIESQFISSFFAHEIVEEAIINKEYYFEYAYSYLDTNNLSSGFMDFVAWDNQEVIIIDIKTDQYEDYELKNIVSEQALLNRYTQQLTMYSQVMYTAYPNKKILAYIYSTELQQMIQVPIQII